MRQKRDFKVPSPASLQGSKPTGKMFHNHQARDPSLEEGKCQEWSRTEQSARSPAGQIAYPVTIILYGENVHLSLRNCMKELGSLQEKL